MNSTPVRELALFEPDKETRKDGINLNNINICLYFSNTEKASA